MVYLFIGQDGLSKDIQLKRLRQEFLDKDLEQFNIDILYSKGLSLATLQEKLLCLPLKSKKRIVAIKGAEGLKDDIQEFLIGYVKKPFPGIILVLDVNRKDPREKNRFIDRITKFVRVYRFKESAQLNTFDLSRQIDLNKTDYALRSLSQLLKNGEKPERILGGLRYSWENRVVNPSQLRRKMRLILDCDIDIKTG
ncbi:MAG: hypothetical protein ABIA66_02990, partial [Candidatus Omnitrophota bacterium]